MTRPYFLHNFSYYPPLSLFTLSYPSFPFLLFCSLFTESSPSFLTPFVHRLPPIPDPIPRLPDSLPHPLPDLTLYSILLSLRLRLFSGCPAVGVGADSAVGEGMNAAFGAA